MKYRMPAEWEPHAGTWLAWPHRLSDWPGKFAPIGPVYAEIIRHLARFETVNVLVASPRQESLALRLLTSVAADLDRVKFWQCPTDRSWLRDSGPIFVKDAKGKTVALDWHFNAWAKYDDWKLDDMLPEFIGSAANTRRVQPKLGKHRIVLEGGSIDVNGGGLLLTTEECLLSEVQERNPPLDRAGYEAVFAEYLGIRKVIWLGQGIEGDDTHGHVDDLARFVGPRTVVTVIERNEGDANYRRLRENHDRLKGSRDLEGRKFDVVTLPMPRPVVFGGQRLPASYANFYIANGIVIVPTFNDPADRTALGTLAELFPDREVVGIHAVDLVYGLGTLHCLTQQQPAGS
jgi:agmatine deiminase